MKKFLLMAFTTTALAACNGTATEPATSTAATAGQTAVAATDATRADARATEVASTIGSVIRGGDPNGRYVLGEALPLYYVHASALASCGGRCSAESLLGEALDRTTRCR